MSTPKPPSIKIDDVDYGSSPGVTFKKKVDGNTTYRVGTLSKEKVTPGSPILRPRLGPNIGSPKVKFEQRKLGETTFRLATLKDGANVEACK